MAEHELPFIQFHGRKNCAFPKRRRTRATVDGEHLLWTTLFSTLAKKYHDTNETQEANSYLENESVKSNLCLSYLSPPLGYG